MMLSRPLQVYLININKKYGGGSFRVRSLPGILDIGGLARPPLTDTAKYSAA